MTDKTINYDLRIQGALRGVIKGILEDVAKHGMPDEHHFLITFATQHPNVQCPDYLAQEHPDEITIIIQHEYENLQIFDDYFKITLGFDDKDEELTIPFEAIVCFVDPYVKFGLHFDDPDMPAMWDEEKNIAVDAHGNPNNVINLEDFRRKKD